LALISKAHILEQFNKLPEALKAYEAVIKADPNNHKAREEWTKIRNKLQE
jgi:hypothetical protein